MKPSICWVINSLPTQKSHSRKTLVWVWLKALLRWAVSPKPRAKTCRSLQWVRCHEPVWIVPHLHHQICMTTSVEITNHHSSTVLTTFLIKLNVYLIPIHAVHALHWAETPYAVYLSVPKYTCSLFFKQQRQPLCTSMPHRTFNPSKVFQNSRIAQPTPSQSCWCGCGGGREVEILSFWNNFQKNDGFHTFLDTR